MNFAPNLNFLEIKIIFFRNFRQFLMNLKHFELSAICKVFFPSLLTELPMLTSVFCARCTRLSPTLTAKARVMWDENSTEIPTAITKFTNDTAFNVIFHLKEIKKKLQFWRQKDSKFANFFLIFIWILAPNYFFNQFEFLCQNYFSINWQKKCFEKY